LFGDTELLNMTSRRELCLEEKINLIKEKDGGLSHREISDRFHISVGAVSNILETETGMHKFNLNKLLLINRKESKCVI
jgi:predicted XRE-type DNA-binding protein